MNRKWTENQQNAINATKGTILVSAAAGSGKTSVLVQRVIEQITDDKNPTDIDKFLIVTFTKAAAQEMKNRIYNELSKMIIKNPENTNLHRQRMILKYSQIGTIDSFCSNIVKENFYKLGISPKINIATENEIKILKSKAMENTLNYFYDLKDENFKKVSEAFSNEKNDEGLSDVIEKIYDFTLSLPFPEVWMDERLETYKNSKKSNVLSENPWIKTVITDTQSKMDISKKLMSQMLQITKNNDELKKAYGEALNKDSEQLTELCNVLNSNNWEKICQKINSFAFSKFKPLKNKGLEYEKNLIATKREYIKNTFKKISYYFSFSQQDILESLDSLYEITETLFKAVKYFKDELYSLKVAENVYDFSDLEHWALQLLTEIENGKIKKSKTAEEISNQYKEIVIDEYQDINEIQDVIFKMISKNENNIFSVGDVKQSIYRFRKSKPDIFLNKKEKFKIYNKNSECYPAKIILGKNFRSKKSIIDGINFIFECLMSKDVGEITYNQEEILFPGAVYPEENEPDINFSIIDTSKSEENSDIQEAQFIANKILEMISKGYTVFENGQNRPITYSDFCILLRSHKAHAHIYKNELFKCGIPTWSESNENFLDTSEISTMISLLQVINNPTQDIPLISILLSPIFDFTIDEVSLIRNFDKENAFYFSLKSYMNDFSENTENKSKKDELLFKKSEYFFKIINTYRQLSVTMPCNELIDLIYNETDYPSMCLATENGELKKANLMLLSEYAKKFENQHKGGLHGFLNFIDGIKRKKSDLPSASISSETENTVKIMSIHKSKGLEFPVCIVAGCSKKFNISSENVEIHSDLGLGIKLKTSDGMAFYDNIVRNAILLQNKREDISEEMRILYVALTRAKQKLFLISSLKEPKQTIGKIFSLVNENTFQKIPPQIISNCNSVTEWLLLCLSQSNLKNKICSLAGLNEYISENDFKSLNWTVNFISENSRDDDITEVEEESICEKNTEVKKINNELFEKLNQRFHFKYPQEDLTGLPLKVSASKLTEHGEWQNYIASSVPNFMSSKNLTPADRGTATHKFMYCMDFKNASQNGVISELNRIKSLGFLDNNESEVIDIRSIEKFIKSEIGKRILKSPQILREHRFSVKIDSKYLGDYNCSENHYTVMQGAVDCAFLENNKFIIVDYKTDKVNSINELWNKYSKQLELYKYAIEQSKNIPVSELVLYSFNLNDCYISK